MLLLLLWSFFYAHDNLEPVILFQTFYYITNRRKIFYDFFKNEVVSIIQQSVYIPAQLSLTNLMCHLSSCEDFFYLSSSCIVVFLLCFKIATLLYYYALLHSFPEIKPVALFHVKASVVVQENISSSIICLETYFFEKLNLWFRCKFSRLKFNQTRTVRCSNY